MQRGTRARSTLSTKSNSERDRKQCQSTELNGSGSSSSSTCISRATVSTGSRRTVLGPISRNSVSKIGKERAHAKSRPKRQAAPQLAATLGTKQVHSDSNAFIPLKIVVEKVSGSNFGELVDLRGKWDSRASNITNPTGLLTSFMAGGASEHNSSTSTASKGVTEEIEMDFLNIINVNVFGTFFRVWTGVQFGQNPKTDVCRLLTDTGSSWMWINKNVYVEACNKAGTRLGRMLNRQVSFYYGVMSERVIGELYEDVVSVGSITIDKQIFAVVDESNQPIVKKWRMFEKVVGIVGLGPTSATEELVIGDPNLLIPSVADQLLDKKHPPAKVVGLNINFPTEPAGNINDISGSHPEAALVLGEFHFGGFKRSLFYPKQPVWIPASKAELGADYMFTLDLRLTCRRKTLMDTYPAVIDTGSPFILVPQRVMREYIEAVEHGQKRIFHWDSRAKAYYITKADFGNLTDVVFKFKGVDIVFPPQAQVIPSSILKQWTNVKDGNLYFIFRGASFKSIRVVILGLFWILRYYLIMDMSEQKKLAIMEVEGKTNYVWQELRL